MVLSVISPLAHIGEACKIYDFVNIYGASSIGCGCSIGAFVEIQPDVAIGNNSKISSHTFVCSGVIIEDEVFIGHGVMFTNDKYPAAVLPDGTPTTAAGTCVIPTRICRRASIGSGSTLQCGITIGEGALVGAGSVVVHDVPPFAVVVGNPAKIIKLRNKQEVWGDETSNS